MYLFICLFLPSIIGIKFIDILIKNLKTKDLIIYYLMLVLFSNTICIIISRFLFNIEQDMIFNLNSCPMFFVKYVLISIILNLIISFIFSLIIKNFSLSLEVVKNDKKQSKKNN